MPDVPRMTRSLLGRVLASAYGRIHIPMLLLDYVTRLEGGQLVSLTLREILHRDFGVKVGPYTYGSLLIPGRSDRFTEIGSYVSIGPEARRFGAAHPMDSLSMHPYWYNSRLGLAAETQDVERTSCKIEPEAWIGSNVTILPRCSRIGIGAVIGAGAVVTEDVPDFGVAVGNPARVIRIRLDEKRRNLLLESRPWDHDPIKARQILDSII